MSGVNEAKGRNTRRLRSPDRLCAGVHRRAGHRSQLDDLCATGRPRKEQTTQKRATEVVAALVAGRSTITLVQLGTELTRLGLAPVRGGNQWAPSSVKALLDRARAAGLLAPTGRQPLSARPGRATPCPASTPPLSRSGSKNFEGSGLQPQHGPDH